MPERLSLRSWRMLGEEALRRGDREFARTLVESDRLPVLEVEDQGLLTRLRGLATSSQGRLR